MTLIESLFASKALDLTVNEGAQEVVAVISAGVIDRDGEVVVPTGLAKEQYQGLPIMKNHDLRGDPYGKVQWIKKDGDNILMKAKFFTISPEQQLNWEMVKHGVYDQWSIGFRYNPETASPPTPQELKKFPAWAKARRLIREWSPYEVSFVGVPANNETMTLAVSKGFSPDALKALEAQIVTDGSKVEKVCDVVTNPQKVVKAISKEDLLRALAKQFKK